MSIRVAKIDTMTAENAKATMALLKCQINLTSMFHDLPEVITETKKQLEARQAQMDRIEKAAEATGIHEVGGVQ